MHGRIALMCMVVSAAAGPAFAEDDTLNCIAVATDNEGATSAQRLAEDKLKLLGAIINKSVSVKRIEQSGDSQAMGLLGQAKDYHREAGDLIARGCIKESDQKLNNGLRAIEDAAHIVVDARYKTEIAEKEYKHRVGRIKSFRDAYSRIVAEKGENTGKYLDEARLDKLLASANAQAQENDFVQANKTIEKAVYMTELALSLVRDQETLIHELKFESVEDQYAYELETNRSYSKLLDLVLKNSDESSPTYTAIEELVRRNDESKATADKIFSAGKTQEALEYLEEGTGHLINAVRYTGIGL
jgi:hypothetical protein